MLKLKGREKVSDSKLDDLRRGLLIDKEALDEAVMQQPVLFDQVAEVYTLSVSQRDEAKTKMEELYDDISLEVRKKGKKVTNDEVSARVGTDPRYKAAVRRYQDSAAKAAEWGTLKESYVQRSYMLREMCGLFVAGYWEKEALKGGASKDSAVRHVREGLRKPRK